MSLKVLNISNIFIGCLFLMAGCAETEKTEEITAEITAAQIEGRRAASKIVSREWPDTLELKRQLLDTKVKQSKYLIEGNKKAADAFDSTFISTIRAVNPSLSAELTPEKKDK